MTEDFKFSRKADRFIIAELISDTKTVKDVLIELYLPQNDNEEIILICRPDSKQYVNLLGKFEFEIIGYDEFIGGEINNKYHIKKAFTKKSYSTFYTSKLEQYTIILQAYNLMIISERGTQEEFKNTNGYFNISDCFAIAPHKMLMRKPKGEIEVLPYDKYSFLLKCGLQLYFETYYKYEETEDSYKSLSYPFTVAEFKTELDPENINEYLAEIDDFLLLLSFAIGKNCLCTGWSAVSNSKIVTFYRRDKVIPPKVKQRSFIDYLIEHSDLQIFLEKAYKTFTNFDDIILLRHILYPVIRRKSISIETHYLMLFAILESVILFNKRHINYEFILNTNDFNTFKDKIKPFIKSYLPLPDDKTRRKYLYDKLPELNRLSFDSSFELFQKDYKVDIDDLWPVINQKDGASLTQIRNKIIHGEVFSNYHFDAISLATIHLQILVERIIFTLLEWDVSKTKVSKEYLANELFDDYEKIKYYQKLFNK
jgi:hypothetical protein